MLVVVGFLACLVAFALVGAAASRASKSTADDYLLAGRSVPPLLVGLSAVATNCSGYMFIGQIGLTYAIGVSSLWLAVGWIVGDAIVWATCYRRIRVLTERMDVRSVPSMLVNGDDRAVARAVAVLVVVFLGTYAGAQLQASGKAMQVMLGVHPAIGAVLGAATVLYYSYSGGLRASIWTDAAQSIVMITTMSALLFVAFGELGGAGGLFATLEAADPSLVDPWRGGGELGFAPWALGWVGAGLGVLGQPTILVRAMAIRTPAELPRAAAAYFGWFVPFYAATIALGLTARALLPELADAELAMPTLAVGLLPPLAVGFMLAGVFAATMSTADSQVLACSAAIVEDLSPSRSRGATRHRRATSVVTALALVTALFAPSGVFALVLFAWSGLGVTLGPLIALRAYGRVVSGRVGLAMCFAGLAGLFGARLSGLSDSIYEIVPGAVLAFATYAVLRSRDARVLRIESP